MPFARASSTLFGRYGSPCRNISPESCFWKPERILISVDLPAPLSPSRPSTSPLRRCRLTSRSAVTGPKRLEMCSTRSTSSGAELGGTTVSVGIVSSATAVPPARALDIDVDRHRDSDRETQIEQQVVGVHALQDQAVAQDAQEQRPDQGTDDRS